MSSENNQYDQSIKILEAPAHGGMPRWHEVRVDEWPGTEPQPVRQSLPDLNFRKILVPFAFSDTSAMLLGHVVPLAKSTGAAVHLLHVIEPMSSSAENQSRDYHTDEDTMADAAQTILRLWRNRIIRGRVPSFATVRVGQRANEIIAGAEALRSDLIVMTARGNCGPACSFSPGTAEQVIRQAPCPVLTFPAKEGSRSRPGLRRFPPPSNWKTVLMPVDFSKVASRTLKLASAITTENHSKLVLLNIMLEGAHVGTGPGSDGQDVCRALERKGKRRLREWVEQEMILPLQFEAVVWTGIPSAWAVPVEARLSKVDVIIMPIRKGSASKQSRERSAIDCILRNASCPVLSV